MFETEEKNKNSQQRNWRYKKELNTIFRTENIITEAKSSVDRLNSIMEHTEERIHKSNDMEQKKLANLNNREKTDWKIKYKE